MANLQQQQQWPESPEDVVTNTEKDVFVVMADVDPPPPSVDVEQTSIQTNSPEGRYSTDLNQ